MAVPKSCMMVESLPESNIDTLFIKDSIANSRECDNIDENEKIEKKKIRKNVSDSKNNNVQGKRFKKNDTDINLKADNTDMIQSKKGELQATKVCCLLSLLVPNSLSTHTFFSSNIGKIHF